VVTRADLKPGYQAVQSLHALQEFGIQYPEVTKEWYIKSNYLGLLSVKSEQDLLVLAGKASTKGVRISVFKEPDIGNEVTAIALEPSPVSKKLCARLPLALS
jgi:hypothetical protein